MQTNVGGASMATTDTDRGETVRAVERTWLQTAREWYNRCWQAGLDLLYPPVCLACFDELPTPWSGPLFCADCRGQLESDGGPQCPFCAAPVHATRADLERCVRCRGVSFRVERIFGLGRYRGLRRDCVLRTKDQSNEPLSTSLGILLAQRFETDLTSLGVEVVVPIPLHWRRRAEHGGNNAEAIAASLASQLRLPYAYDGLSRTRFTVEQSRMSARQRRENVRGTMAVSAAYEWTDARVLLVDDILTTGATANEAAKVLQAAGASAVFIAVVARGVGET